MVPVSVPAAHIAGAGCAAPDPIAAQAVARRSPIALYYGLKLALVNGEVFEWRGNAHPRRVLGQATHVAVNAGSGFAIDTHHRALHWVEGSNTINVLLDNVAFLAAGESSLMAIRCDGSLWQRKAGTPAWHRIADAATHAWVGDSADYYIDAQGTLFASGKAHRGQYGNGSLVEAPGWLAVAQEAVAVYSHTGHAVFLRRDGGVMGTGGNRFGPLGTHGYGDKAECWGVIFEGASRLGTGASHSMAIRADGSLWGWGAADGLQAKPLLADVAAAIGGDTETLALQTDGSVWHWPVGSAPRQVIFPR